MNEGIKELHDKQVTKLKQQDGDMRESLRKVEAKYYPDLDTDSRSGYTNRDPDRDPDRNPDRDPDKESSKDLDQSGSEQAQSKDSDRD